MDDRVDDCDVRTDYANGAAKRVSLDKVRLVICQRAIVHRQLGILYDDRAPVAAARVAAHHAVIHDNGGVESSLHCAAATGLRSRSIAVKPTAPQRALAVPID